MPVKRPYFTSNLRWFEIYNTLFTKENYNRTDASISRLGRLLIVITSNRPPQDWYGRFPDPVVGGAILDRLVPGAIKIIVNRGDTYCKKNGISMNNIVDGKMKIKIFTIVV
ncbi:MAG: ATP-binding protein [Spirochaetota bacterium]